MRANPALIGMGNMHQSNSGKLPKGIIYFIEVVTGLFIYAVNIKFEVRRYAAGTIMFIDRIDCADNRAIVPCENFIPE